MTPMPEDPRIRQLVSMLSRRRVLQYGLIGGAGALVAACGGGIGGASTSPSASASGAPTAKDMSSTEKIMNWSNWPLYIDVGPNKSHPSLDAFKKATGITVNYTEDYNDNNEFYAKVHPQLQAGQPIGRDLITATDWMAHIWIANGYAELLDLANIPNHKNIGKSWQNVSFDPGRKYSMPWQSGSTGIGWNRAELKRLTGKTELRTLDELWDPRLKGRVTILSEMNDSMGLMLMAMGKRADKFTDADFSAAIAEYQKYVNNGQIRGITGNDYATSMASGTVVAAVAWSGDMLSDTKTYGYSIPESGGMLWTDNMLIPPLAAHKTNAEKWMDFYYQPEIAAMVAAYVKYISPVAGAQEAMKKVDPTQVNNPAIFPDAATLAKLQVFMPLTDIQRTNYQKQFQALSGA